MVVVWQLGDELLDKGRYQVGRKMVIEILQLWMDMISELAI